MKKVNTSAYHPQADGLVERCNHTLLDMLAKTVKQNGRTLTADRHLSCLYTESPSDFQRENPFYPRYGRAPRLPTEATCFVPTATFHPHD